MLPQRLRGTGRALFRAVSPRASLGSEGGGGSGGGGSIWEGISLPSLRRKASNTLSAVQDAFLSTKEIFEKHRVVFTVGTSVASVLTAWAGYSLRQLHQSKLEKRLESIEQTLKSSYDVEHDEIKKIVSSGSVSTAACIATAWTSLLVGYGLGWRSGAWYANRKFRREQLKLMGQIKPYRWQFLRKPYAILRTQAANKTAEKASVVQADSLPLSQNVQKSC